MRLSILKRTGVLFLGAFFFLARLGYAEIIDKIVAVVNDEPITQSELEINFAPIYQQFVAAYRGQDLSTRLEEARANVLNQLVEDKLVYQEALRKKVPVDDSEIDKKLDELKKSFASEEEFYTKLREQGLTLRALRKRFREQVAITKIHQFEILSRIVISPQEIQAYYEEHLEEFTESERASVRTIMLRKTSEEAEDLTRQRLEEILATITTGASFSAAAEKFSNEAHAASGGNLGFVKRGEMIPEIDRAIFDTPVGAISPIVETDLGFHVYFVEAKQEKKTAAFQEKQEQIHQLLFRKRAEARYNAWIKELKAKSYISIK